MRIGLFSDTYVPDINGVATSVVTLQNALEEAGHTVYVVTTQSTLMSATLSGNILRLPGIELKFLYGYTMSPPIHPGAMRAIKEMNLDIIHVHTEFGVGIFARDCAKYLHIPLVTTYHTQYEDYTHYINFLRLKSVDAVSKKAVASLSRYYSKNVQLIIAPSEKTQKMLMKYDIRKKIDVIPTGLDLNRFKNVNETRVAEIRKEYDLENVFTIIYLGRIAKEKSIDTVIEAFSELYKTKPDTRLLIAGGGPSIDELKVLAANCGVKDAVIFTGSISREDVPSFYHASNAFISASLTETQGLTYIEALASGLCVFARPDRPLDGLVLEGKTGYLFNDSKDFVEKATYLIENYSELKSFIEVNAQEIVKEYDSETFANKIIHSYQDAIDSYHGKYTIMSIEENDDKVLLELGQGNEQERMVFDAELVKRRELEVGMKLSRNEISSLDEDQTVYEAYQSVLKRIAIRDYTSFELSEYLRTKFQLNEEQIETILSILRNRRFIDDERYLRDKVDYHRDQLRGNDWIIDDLTRRGFSALDIEDYLFEEENSVYIERGLKRAIHYLSMQKDGSRLQRNQKVRQHLQRQGYESHIIKEIMSQLEDDYALDDERAALERVLSKAYIRYLRKGDEKNAKMLAINYAVSKGYSYDLIKEVMEDIDNDIED